MNLQQLAQQMERQKKLLTMVGTLKNQAWDLEAKAEALRKDWEKEQRDVDRLNSQSLTSLFYDLIGAKDGKLEKEQREVLAAAAKYRTAQAELENVRGQIKRVQGELVILDGSEERYWRAYGERVRVLKSTDPEKGPKIIDLEAQKAEVCAKLQELREAIHAGEEAQRVIGTVEKEMNSAESWGVYDMIAGGLLANVVKHEHLDNAQASIGRLQDCLRRYRTELVDVQIQADLSVDISDFLRFADWFFDGFFVDWTVQDRISDAHARICTVQEQIVQIQRKLHAMETDWTAQDEEIQKKINDLIIE